MGTTQLEPLAVLFVSASGRTPTAERSVTDVDPRIQASFVESTDEAHDRLSDDDVHCVVCEHDPPRVDAISFVETVREEGSQLPILVVPDDDGADCVRAALTAGATDVVESPSGSVSPAILANRIRAFVEGPSGSTHEPTASDDGERPSTTADRAGDAIADDHVASLGDAIETLRTADRRDVVGDVVVDVLEEVLDAPGVGVFCFDEESNHLRPVAITDRMVEYYGGETVFGTNRPDSVTWQVFVTGEKAAFEDLRSVEGRVNEGTDARASMFVPLGEHGAVAVATDEVGPFSEARRRLVELVAAAAGATLDRIASDAVARRQDRELDRQVGRLRDADRIIELACQLDDAIVAATTRTEIERGILDRLGATDWVDFAWIGAVEAETNTPTPREWTAGGDQYVDDLTQAKDAGEEPAARTARDRAITHVPNVAEQLDGGWERTVLSQGFHAVLSVPLVYQGVLYGVLTMYADRPDAFPDRFRSVVAAAGKSGAHAINAAERAFCVLSNGVTELDLRVEDEDDALNVVAANAGTAIECHELEPLPDGSTKLRFSAVDVSAASVLARTARLGVVDSVTHVSGDEEHLFTAELTRETVGSTVVTAGGMPVAITADGTHLDVTATIPRTVEARTFVDRLDRQFRNVTMLARRERDPVTLTRTGFLHELESVLTDRQMEVLLTAHDNGFFESPRAVTGQDVAELLNISQPTVSHHLRESQGKLFDLLFDDN